MQTRSDSNYKGIDVSHWQGSINYTKVKNAGIDIVYIKATQGQSFVDSQFKTNAVNAKKNGLLVGFYHYFTATTTDAALKEAAHFVDTIKPYSYDCRLALDVETTNNLSNSTLVSLCKTFLEEVEKLSGSGVVIYTYTSFIKEHLNSSLASYPLWIAQYGVRTPSSNGVWDSWVGFQYSESGKVSGVSGDTDLDEFTSGILLSSSSTPSTPSTPSVSTKTINYTVKKGDTLSEIAVKYGTTVDSLVELNNIKNPDLIYIGQVLKINASVNNISTPDTYTVKKGDTLSEIAAKYGTTVNNLVKLNNIKNPDLIYPGQVFKLK